MDGVAGVIILILIVLYTVWAVRKIYLDKKKNKSRCGSCPYHQSGVCTKEDKIKTK